MKGRKFLALLLCLALCAGLAVPALAADADEALMAVTAKVKAALELDTDIYEDFQGQSTEDALLGTRWTLEWSGDGVWMNITADSDGKIYSLYRSQAAVDEPVADSWYLGSKLNIPRLPQDKSKAAFAAAKDFLGKVLDAPVETIELSDSTTPSLRQDSYHYSGTVLLNGLPSPITCSVTVRASDLSVTRFWRGDEHAGYLGGVPTKDTTHTAAQARALLRSTVKMQARYVLGKDGKTATVQYLPLPRNEYYVDGATGKLVDLTELRTKLLRFGGANGAYKYDGMVIAEMAAAADAGGSQTQAEKDGAAILAGTLDKEALDQSVKNAWPELGLEKYTLASASYQVQEKPLTDDGSPAAEDRDVVCRLTYGRQEGDVMRNKYVTVDAKTGVLQALSSRRSYYGEGKDPMTVSIRVETAQATAETFLTSFAGARRDQLALAETSDAAQTGSWQHTYAFQQKAGQWFYPANHYTIGIDGTDGTICHISSNFDDDVVLKQPEKVITVEEAIDAYVSAMDVPYLYCDVPVSISLAGSELMPLLKDAGYDYVLALKTGWTLTQPKDRYIEGVDAESGQLISWDTAATPSFAITYGDLDGHWVRTAAEALATFGIGLRGGDLNPGSPLTQLDMIALLASVEGYEFDPATAHKDDIDWLYQRAYTLGLVTPETRDETGTVTRGELVRLILDAAGYRRIAALEGIFRCNFADSSSIPAADMGYAALAQGLGLVKGGSDGAYAPSRAATRAEAIAMLYQYMK